MLKKTSSFVLGHSGASTYSQYASVSEFPAVSLDGLFEHLLG
jgi:hypothetical protein